MSPFVEFQRLAVAPWVLTVAPWVLAVVGVLMLAAPAGLRPLLAAATIGAALPVLAGPPLASLPFHLARGDVESAVLPPAMIVAAAAWCLLALLPVARRGRLARGWQITLAVLAAMVVIASSPTRSLYLLIMADVEFAFVPVAALAVGLVPRRVGMALIGGFAVSTAAAVAEWSQRHGIDTVVVWTLLALAAMTLIAAVAALRVQPVTTSGGHAIGVLARARRGLRCPRRRCGDPQHSTCRRPRGPGLTAVTARADPRRCARCPTGGIGHGRDDLPTPVLVGLFAVSMGWSGFYVASIIPDATHIIVIVAIVLAFAAELLILLAIARTTIRNGAWLWGTVTALLSIGLLSTVAVGAANDSYDAWPAWLGAVSVALVALAALFRRPTYLGAALLGGLGVGGLIVVARLDLGRAYGIRHESLVTSYLSMLGVVVIAAGLAWLARRHERGVAPVQ